VGADKSLTASTPAQSAASPLALVAVAASSPQILAQTGLWRAQSATCQMPQRKNLTLWPEKGKNIIKAAILKGRERQGEN
jgi:hypothetical protein